MKKINNQTYLLENPVYIHETASIVGPKEKDGPMANYFDTLLEDEFWGEKSWEKAESKIVKETVNSLISKTNLSSKGIGDKVNLECDVIGKYVEKLLTPVEVKEEKKSNITEEFLRKYGF